MIYAFFILKIYSGYLASRCLFKDAFNGLLSLYHKDENHDNASICNISKLFGLLPFLFVCLLFNNITNICIYTNVACKIRDTEDHISWLLQHGWHEKALAAVEAGQGRSELLDEVF